MGMGLSLGLDGGHGHLTCRVGEDDGTLLVIHIHGILKRELINERRTGKQKEHETERQHIPAGSGSTSAGTGARWRVQQPTAEQTAGRRAEPASHGHSDGDAGQHNTIRARTCQAHARRAVLTWAGEATVGGWGPGVGGWLLGPVVEAPELWYWPLPSGWLPCWETGNRGC